MRDAGPEETVEEHMARTGHCSYTFERPRVAVAACGGDVVVPVHRCRSCTAVVHGR